MASKIKVDQIEGSTGSSITIPSGQTLTITDGLASSTITSRTLADARIPNLNASKINAGTIPVARGGTGLTSLGSAGQVVKVNSGASALEFGTVSSDYVKIKTVDISEQRELKDLGVHPETNRPVTVRLTRYGPTIQMGTKEDEEKPKWAALTPEQKKNIDAITLDDAIRLFKLPEKIGEFEGDDILINIGPFGPYVNCGKTNVSLKDVDIVVVEVVVVVVVVVVVEVVVVVVVDSGSHAPTLITLPPNSILRAQIPVCLVHSILNSKVTVDL